MLRNIGSNWVLSVVSIAATYFLTPFTIKTLGQDGYGTWTLITALTGHITLLSLGVPSACVRYLSQHIAAGDVRRMNETIGSCAGLYLGIGVVAAVGGALLLLVFQSYPGFGAESRGFSGVVDLSILMDDTPCVQSVDEAIAHWEKARTN